MWDLTPERYTMQEWKRFRDMPTWTLLTSQNFL